ncbi:hypothetical protein [Citrobacter koseri]|uniref:hypothetical protein n=1 Tax=Citrobacter koseri TaxID=545 RepID=UPI001907972F|nr:hypothetical protein [Citrobacter koseri]MBJ8684426.1 hypothetical protein [Citrobacter koseri]
MQMFIEGTSFDAANAMSFTYVIDFLTVSGTGSKTYNTSGFDLSVVGMNSTLAPTNTQSTIDASISGTTLTWNTDVPLRLVVTATARQGANSGYSGFALYTYPNNQRTIKLAPDFTPFVLSAVINIEPGARTVDTGVAVGDGVIIFMRNRNNQGGACSRSHFTLLEPGTYKMQFTAAANNQFPTRAYVFSRKLPPTPKNGFYLYKDGVMVWHSNCLPLDAKFINQSYVESDYPLAVTTGITNFIYIPQDPTVPEYGFQNYGCSGAGIGTNGKWRTNNTEVYQSFLGNVGIPLPKGWVVGTRVMYIECSNYDNYYTYSLGS